MRTLTHCIVCNHTRFRTVYKSTFEGSAQDAPEFFLSQRRKVVRGTIVACDSCGFTFTNPQFEIDEYSAIYAKAPRPEPNKSMLEAELLRFSRLQRLIDGYCPASKRMLDLGCGDGTFLSMSRAKEKIGFEIGEIAVNEQTDFAIMRGDLVQSLRDGVLPRGSFDVITAWDVLEHLPDLESYMVAISDLLEPGGHFFATVPNVKSIVAKLSGASWNLILLEHLWYFSPHTLERFLVRFGLTQVACGRAPFDVSVAHFAARIAQTYGVDVRKLVQPFNNRVISLPIGLISVVFRKAGSAKLNTEK